MIAKAQLGAWMEKERLHRGLTKGAISEQIGISVGQYSSYVAGKSVPRGKTLEKIARAYGRPIDEVNALLVPVEIPAEPETVVASEVDCNDPLIARIGLLEAKLDYAVKLLEQMSRS